MGRLVPLTLSLLLTTAVAPVQRAWSQAPPDHAASPMRPPDQSLDRIYTRALHYGSVVTYYLAVGLDLGFEHNDRRGFLIGFEAAPLTAGQTPVLTLRLNIGYTRPSFAVGFAVAAGFGLLGPNNLDQIVQFGPFVRIGHYERTYLRLRINWVKYTPEPWDVALDLVARTAARWRFHFAGGWNADPYVGGYFTLGGQYLLSGYGGPRSHVFTFGLGLVVHVNTRSFNRPAAPGPLLSAGYEYRF